MIFYILIYTGKMDSLFVDLLIDIIVLVLPIELDVIRQVNKRMNNILTLDRFWKLYFERYVNKKYIIEPEHMVSGQWKKAFRRNYNRFLTWRITFYNHLDYACYRKHNIKSVIDSMYYNVSKFSFSFLPLIHPECFDHKEYNVRIETFLHNMFANLSIYKNSKLLSQERITEKQMLLYPYHHCLKFDYTSSKAVDHHPLVFCGGEVRLTYKLLSSSSPNIIVPDIKDMSELSSLTNIKIIVS